MLSKNEFISSKLFGEKVCDILYDWNFFGEILGRQPSISKRLFKLDK